MSNSHCSSSPLFLLPGRLELTFSFPPSPSASRYTYADKLLYFGTAPPPLHRLRAEDSYPESWQFFFLFYLFALSCENLVIPPGVVWLLRPSLQPWAARRFFSYSPSPSAGVDRLRPFVFLLFVHSENFATPFSFFLNTATLEPNTPPGDIFNPCVFRSDRG